MAEVEKVNMVDWQIVMSLALAGALNLKIVPRGSSTAVFAP